MNKAITKRSLMYSRLAALFAGFLPIIAMIGWGFNVPILTKFSPQLPAMPPDTIIGLYIAVFAVFCNTYRYQRFKLKFFLIIIDVLLVIFGLLTLLQYAMGRNFEFDVILYENLNNGFVNPGRASPQGAFNFILLGLALIFSKLGNRYLILTQLLVIFLVSNSMLALTAFIFNTRDYFGIPNLEYAKGMAFPTSVSFILLAVALVLGHTKKGVMSLIFSDTRSSWIARCLLVVSIVVPPVLGLLTKVGVILGWYDHGTHFSLFTLLLITTFVWTTWQAAWRSEKEELISRYLLTKVQKAREQNENLVKYASDGIFIANPRDKFMEMNEAGCEMLSYAREEILNLKIVNLIHNNDVAKFYQLKETITQGTSDLVEIRFKRKDASYIYTEVSAKILSGGSWLGIFRDISKRKAIQLELEASESKFRCLLESAFDAIVIVDEKGFINFVNKQVLSLFGYESSELVGRNIDLLFPSRFSDELAFFKKFDFAKTDGNVKKEVLELFALRKNGSEFAIQLEVSPSVSSAGKVLTAIIRDISESKRIEVQTHFLAKIGKVLFESLNYQKTLEKVAEIIVPELADACVVRLLDDEGNDYVAAAVHSSKEKKEIIENLANRMGQAEGTKYWIKKIAKNSKSIVLNDNTSKIIKQINSFTSSCPHQSKKLEIKSIAFLPLRIKSETLGYIAIIMDESKRVITDYDIAFFEEVALRISLSIENAKLYLSAQQAIKNREDILEIVSHDLKSPLSGIGLAVQALRSIRPNASDLEVKLFSTLKISTDQMEKLILDLLDFAKFQSGTFSIDCKPNAINEILDYCLPTVMIQLNLKELSLNINIEPLLPKVSCDKHRIGQVITNLLINASKFTPKGGKIELNVRRIGKMVQVSIKDEGPGIPENVKSKIFDRYWQAEETKNLGSGLGLAIAKGIIDIHNGTIDVESKLGIGSNFYFTLPIDMAQDAKIAS